jgi:polyhydroxybutyrate depolymerase
MRRALVLVLVVLTASCSAGSPTPETGPETSPTVTLPPEIPGPGDQLTAFLDGEGKVREYLVHAPPSYSPDKQYPLVLVFHGQPGTPEEMVEMTGMNDVADANDFLVVYPTSVFDTEKAAALLDHVVPTWNVDPSRVHAAGFSRGGSLVYRLPIDMPERFGSVAPVSASNAGPVRLAHPVSLITFQGSADRLRGAWSSTNGNWDDGAGCSDENLTEISMQNGPTEVSTKPCEDGTEHVVYRITGMGHAWPDGASELIWEFFARHPLA